MATNYPGAIDSFPTPNAGSSLDSPSHSGLHANINDASIALQKNLGIIKYVTSDVVNDNATPNTLQNVTGLSVALTSGKTYFFEVKCLYTANASTTGSRWTINGPTFDFLSYESKYSLAATTRTINARLTAYQLPASSNATSSDANGGGNFAQLEGIIKPNANGNLVVQFASEVASAAITAKPGSFIRVQELI
jgi:hypothetical protein